MSISLIHKLYINYLKTQKRKSNKQIFENKLEVIIWVLKSGVPWNSLNDLKFKYTESNYRKFFYQLCNLRLLNDLFEYLKTFRQMEEISFIDSTNVRNKHGKSNSIGFCPQDKKHKGNKISLIVSEKGEPLGCSVDKASVHDLNLFEETIKNVKTKVIIGDKGYTSNKLKCNLMNRSIKLLYPFKKNSNKTHNIIDKKLLKKRSKVENIIGNLKKMKRIDSRYERNLNYFIGFVKLGLLLMIYK